MALIQAQTSTAPVGNVLAYSPNPRVGSILVCSVTVGSGGADPVVVRATGETWDKIGTIITGGNGEKNGLFICYKSLGGSTSVGWGVASQEVAIAEYDGVSCMPARASAVAEASTGGTSVIESGFASALRTGPLLLIGNTSHATPAGVPAFNSGFTSDANVSNNQRLDLVSRYVSQTDAYHVSTSNALLGWITRFIAIQLETTTYVKRSGARVPRR